MDKILILYKSKYGATEKYACMLKEILECEILKTEHYNKAVLDYYDCIVFAGGIYASGISGLEVLRKHYTDIKHKKLAVLCVGASPFDEKAIDILRQHNLKDTLKEIQLIYARGAWDESAMTFKDRTLCRLLQKAIAKKDPAGYEPWMTALMSAVGQKCDWTDRVYLEPLINYLQQ